MNRILSIIYDFFIFLAMSVNLIIRRIQKKSDPFIQKFTTERFANINFIPPAGKTVYWIHSVSVGEVGAAKIVADEIKKAEKSAFVVSTVFTLTGYAEATKKDSPLDKVFFCPMDTSALTKRFLNIVTPKALIIIDGDFWIKMITETANKGIPVFVVNAKVSKKSARFYAFLKKMKIDMFTGITKIYTQNKEYAKRFKLIGIPPEKIQVAGNVKISLTPKEISAEELSDFKKEMGLPPFPIVSFNSIHPEEIPIISKTIQLLRKEFPTLGIIIAPRHPVKYINLNATNDTYLIENASFYSENSLSNQHKNIVWINKMGIMPFIYTLSKVAFIGGTFTAKVGGHNIIEPCFYDTPSCFGPFTHTQKALKKIAYNFNISRQVSDEKELFEFMRLILKNTEEYKEKVCNTQKMKTAIAHTCSDIVQDLLHEVK